MELTQVQEKQLFKNQKYKQKAYYIETLGCQMNVADSELIIARSSGLNIWHCCLPYVLLAFIMGIFSITVLSSITAVTQKNYHN